MKFLVAFLAVVGYASANLIAPLGLGLNGGDVQAAVINSGVVARNNAQAWTDAARQNVDISRGINENILWNGVTANQNAVAAAQSQVAAVGGAISGAVGVAPWGIGAGVAPIAAAPWGVAGHGLVNGLEYGLGAW